MSYSSVHLCHRRCISDFLRILIGAFWILQVSGINGTIVYPKWTDGKQDCTVPVPRFTCDIDLYNSQLKELNSRNYTASNNSDFEAIKLNKNLTQIYPLNATNVRRLRPSNIKVIASLGDSMTAGLFSRSWTIPFTLRPEFRASAYSNGGDPNFVTIGNILKLYSPDIMGLSTERTGLYGKDHTGLNMAITATVTEELLPQIDRLHHRLTQNPDYNGSMNEWKLINIWTGVIDVCRGYDLQVWEKHLRMALDRIKELIPKVFVNIVTYFPVGELPNVASASLWCRIAQPILRMCPRMNINSTDPDGSWFDNQMNVVNQRLTEVAKQYQDLNDTQFTVVAQTSLQSLDLSLLKGRMYVSKFDCFHPNQCGSQFFAFSVWNSMFTRQNAKPLAIANAEWVCPSPSDYLM